MSEPASDRDYLASTGKRHDEVCVECGGLMYSYRPWDRSLLYRCNDCAAKWRAEQ